MSATERGRLRVAIYHLMSWFDATEARQDRNQNDLIDRETADLIKDLEDRLCEFLDTANYETDGVPPRPKLRLVEPPDKSEPEHAQ